MFKYILIVVLNLPLVLLGAARAIEAYKTGRSTRLRLICWLLFWTVIAIGLCLAQPGYEYLQRNRLTDSTPLSLFDIVEITGLNLALTLIFRLYAKNDALEQRVANLNREVSLRLAEISKK